MSVYVGIDVHRKRSQVAVIDSGGEVLANRNVPNGTETILGVIDDDLALIDAVQVPIGRVDAEVRQRARSDPRVKILAQLPGVGTFTALVILAEAGDITRFGSARKLASWAGLTPTVRGSDRTVRHGHISQQRSAWLLWILCEAAQTAKLPPGYSSSYASIARPPGKESPTTTTARTL